MHRSTLVLAFGLLAFQASARNGFYIAPALGAGISSEKQKFFYADEESYRPDADNVFSYSSGLYAGYNFKKWRLETGFQYTVSGYKYSNITLGAGVPISIAGTLNNRYAHLSVPIRLGYAIRLNNKLSFIPYAGIVASYNLGARTTINVPGELEAAYRWTSKDFKDYYKSVSLWGSLALWLEYALHDRLSIFAGPAAQYMISNFMNVPADARLKPSARVFLAHIELGLKLNI